MNSYPFILKRGGSKGLLVEKESEKGGKGAEEVKIAIIIII